ncbi:hypothetical protein BDY21DRAFT_364147 [Lineolata rhizophorae]|uniref:DUF7025 domain-containing protein n=1 Tax=Lineolata rhizophorae TaxID=578093 RepID=A0A6A6NZR3_9PEZI|nr:hypothetical protein BDY21DRAFT_364147 [Lineolata rhizophorae]
MLLLYFRKISRSTGEHVNFDGDIFSFSDIAVEIKSFKGARRITSLPCYPIGYHRDKESIERQLINHGRKFTELAGLKYKSYTSNPELGLARRNDREFELKCEQRSSSMRSLRLGSASTSSQRVAQALVEVYTIDLPERTRTPKIGLSEHRFSPHVLIDQPTDARASTTNGNLRCGEAPLESHTVVANILWGRKSLISPRCGRVVSEGSRFNTPGSQNWAPSHPV